jgi:tetratricopeptide (TPR) repeat protein
VSRFFNPADPHRRTKIAAAVVAVVTIVCLLALVIIIAREQVTGAAIAVEEAAGAGDAASERAALEALARDDPHDASAQQELAVLARDEGRWVDAAAHWARVAKLDPTHANAHFEQARNLLAAGDAPGVVAALTADGRAPTAREQVVLARACLMQGERDAARAAADAALRERRHDPAARLLIADLAFIDGDDAAAESGYQGLVEDPQTAAAAGLGLAQLAVRRGDEDAAIERLTAMQVSPSLQVLSARAGLYRQLGRFDLAEADYRALVDRYGPEPEVVVPLAELRAAADDADGVRALRTALTGTDTVALATRHYLQAIEDYLRGDLDSARDKLGWSADFFAGRDLYRWMQVDIGARLGDMALASTGVESLRRGVVGKTRRLRAAAVLAGQAADAVSTGDVETAEALSALAQELVPGLAAATLVHARAALLRGERERARSLALDLIGNAESGDYGNAALEVLGRAELADGDLDAARSRFDALAEAMPDAAIGPYWQGVTAFRAGDLASGEALLREALARRDDPRVESALVEVLIAAKSWDEAEALARRVIAAPRPRDQARGFALLGGVLRAQGLIADAAAAYGRAAELDPGRTPYALVAADLHMDAGQFEQARALLDAAERRDGHNRFVLFKQALLAQRAGRGDEAVERYRALLRETPDWALPMVNLSELLAAGDATRDEALRLAERAAELTPDWIDAQWSLAQREAEAGADDAALRAARRVLALAPDHAGAAALVAGGEGGR